MPLPITNDVKLMRVVAVEGPAAASSLTAAGRGISGAEEELAGRLAATTIL